MQKWVLVWVVSVMALSAVGQERLVLVGGGDIPAAAAERFVSWAGGPKARLLLIDWATSIPEESDAYLREVLTPYQPATIETAPFLPAMATQKAIFLEQLARATGVFFGGGDQNRVMDLLDANPDLLVALRKSFTSTVFGGTSAGTAIMSGTMITGEGDFTVIDASKVGTRPGIGLTRDLIVDQHFIKRQRTNRLFSLVLKSSERFGLGIDEGTAVALEDSRTGQVLGPNPAMLVDGRSVPGKLLVEMLAPNQTFDLTAKR